METKKRYGWYVGLVACGTCLLVFTRTTAADGAHDTGPHEESSALEFSSSLDFRLDFSSSLAHLGMLQDEVGVVESAPPPSGGDAAAAEMARKLQDPLANIKAIMTDNDILFGTGDDEVSYSFQIQPVYAIDFPDSGFSLVLRGIIPIVGMAPGADRPLLEEPVPADSSRVWGIGDSVAQAFFAPKSESAWKFGFGPQVSLRTRTDSRLGGPGWGAGPIGIIAGSLGAQDEISIALIGGHLWSFDGAFSTSMIQPMVFYNFADLPGLAISYNNVITYDWKGGEWTVPLGFSVGQVFELGDGYGLEVSVGPYWNVVKPDGSNDWSIKFGINLILP